MKICALFCGLIGLGLINLSPPKHSIDIPLTKILIVDKTLEPILDTILTIEKQRNYYYPDLLFSIRILPNNFIDIQAIDKTLYNESYKGVIRYQEHYFLVSTDSLGYINNKIFLNTDEKINVEFWKDIGYINESGIPVLNIIDDDSKSMWRYYYSAGEYKLVLFIDTFNGTVYNQTE